MNYIDKRLKLVFPHHAFDGAIWLAAVLGIGLLVVFYLNFSLHRKIYQLTDWHAVVNFYGLLDRNFQRPIATKANITLACSGVNINTQAACGRFTFQERNMLMCFSVFLCYTQIKT